MLPVLTTKLQIPHAHPNTVSRPHLIERLDEGLWHAKGEDFVRRLTLVAAPAGYGKTTLLCEWIGHLKVPSAWITFDESDSNPGSFLHYLVASLQTIQPGLGETVLAVFQSPQFPGTQLSIPDVMAALVNEIAALSRPFILVLDDYHTLEEQAIHQAVMFLLDQMPEKLSLVIATRADPPLLLSRLRASRQLAEVRAEDLRFSECEATVFLRQVMHLDVQDEQVGVLTERTEGWVAGLQMAALALQGHDDIAAFVRDFSGRQRFVIDYLFEEVLRRQAEPIRTFLVQTSVLDRMTGPLCEAVFGKPESGEPGLPFSSLAQGSGQQILETLERANLFVVPLDNERCWYRYHQLFADLLRHRLRRNFPDLIPHLHLRAAEWFESQGNISDALGHLIEANDFGNAARLVEKFGWEFLTQGRFQQMLVWLQQIPEELIRAHPWLCIFYSWGLIFAGQTSRGELYLSAAENALSSIAAPAEPDTMTQLGHIAALRAYLAALNQDVTGITDYAHRALQLLPAAEGSMRSFLEYFLGYGRLLTDDLSLAEEAFASAASRGEEAGNKLIAVNALCALADVCQARGQIHRALDIYAQATNLAADERGQALPVVAEIYVGKAGLHYAWNDLKAAEDDLLAARKIGKLYSNFSLIVSCAISLSRVRLAQGDLQGAEELLQEVERDERLTAVAPSAFLLAHQMTLHQSIGDLAKVSRLAKQHEWRPDDTRLFAWGPAFIAYARFLLAQGESQQAHDLLETCLTRLRACGLQMLAIKALVVQAAALGAQGKQSLAEAKMELALSQAEEEGLVRTFVDEGEPVRSLLAGYRAQLTQESKAADRSDIRLLAYVDRLLSAFPTPASEKAKLSSAAGVTPSVLVEPLTARELEVLQLIAAGLSNQEIADRLVVTVGTVKAHSSAIYRKLDVPGRTRAVAVARELHII